MISSIWTSAIFRVIIIWKLDLENKIIFKKNLKHTGLFGYKFSGEKKNNCQKKMEKVKISNSFEKYQNCLKNLAGEFNVKFYLHFFFDSPESL